MSKFGWSYPPGAALDPSAPYNQVDDPPCEVCGRLVADCICPECATCGKVGAMECIKDHDVAPPFGMVILTMDGFKVDWAGKLLAPKFPGGYNDAVAYLQQLQAGLRLPEFDWGDEP